MHTILINHASKHIYVYAKWYKYLNFNEQYLDHDKKLYVYLKHAGLHPHFYKKKKKKIHACVQIKYSEKYL